MSTSGIPLNSVIERILALLFDSNRRRRAKLSLFIGAGVSREYGIPTSFGFAKRFFADALSGMDESTRASIDSLSSEEQIHEFVCRFKEQLDSDLAYAFFKNVEKESLSATHIEEVITYDRIIDMWRNGYVKIIVSTNFDSLIERKIESLNRNCEPPFEITVLDYHDLAHEERPTLLETAVLVKIAGQIERSNMLWTEQDFKQNLTERVLMWLTGRIDETPALLLGYTASEAPLAELLARHKQYAASVAPQPLAEIKNLLALSNRREHLLDHVEVTASDFVATLYESLYQHTKDPNLALSYYALVDRINRLNADRVARPNLTPIIERASALRLLQEFSRSREPGRRCLLLLGESGYGKSTLIETLAAETKDELYIHIPGNELNHTLDEWLSRLDNVDVGYVCRLTRLLSKNLVLVIDGLNECLDTLRAKTILQDVIRVLDLYNDGHVRVIVTCRPEYWAKLRFDFNRVYVDPPAELGPFDNDELERAVSHLSGVAALNLPRWSYVRELLRVPQTYGFFVQLGQDPYAALAETTLYQALLAKRQSAVEGANRALIWLCSAMRDSHRLNVPLMDAGADAEVRASLMELAGVGTLQVNRFDIIRFAEDRLAEFVFGQLYLYEYCWQSGRAARNIHGMFQELISEYRQSGADAPDYKVHLLNSLAFFAARCSDDEIITLYRAGSTFERTIIRSAILLRRSFGTYEELSEDPVIMAVAVLDKANYQKLLRVLLSGEDKFFTTIPFNYGAKLFPENFLDFIEFLAAHIVDQKIALEKQRRYSTLLVNSVLIYLLRNGPEQLLKRSRLLANCRELIERTPKDFIAARLCESIEENSRYLFHYHPTDKLSDLLHLEWYWRERLLEALRGSVFDLAWQDLLGLLHLGSAARLVMRFLFARDIYDPRLSRFVNEVFQAGDAVAYDFCMGVLGLAGKLDAAFVPLSAEAVARMCKEATQSFYRSTLGDFEDDDSQYDPLVPHVTTLMLRGLPLDLASLMPVRDKKSAFRVGRLAQKTILDFPDETLDFIYRFLEDGEGDPEIQIALRTAARFSPASFWKVARRRQPEDLFEVPGEEIAEITRVLAQVRDFDWVKTVAFVIVSPARKRALAELLVTFLKSTSLEAFFQSLIEKVGEAPTTDVGRGRNADSESQ
jgi:energy-coupling factor transporter ATP-binding protein EcfA2